MQANDLLEHRDKIIDAFKDSAFSSEHLKKLDAATHDYVLKDVADFIQEIKSMEEKIIYVCLRIFLNYYQLIIQKYLLILRIQMKAKEL